MSTVDVAALRAAAEGALAITSLAAVIGGQRWRLDGWPDELVEFIATFDPPTILALLDRLEAAEGAVERVRGLADEWESLLGGYIDPSEHSTGYARATRRHAERLRAALDGDQ